MLTAASVIELAIAIAIGAFAAIGVGLGVVAAPVAVIAILRHGERAVSVYLAFLPILFFLLHPLFISD